MNKTLLKQVKEGAIFKLSQYGLTLVKGPYNKSTESYEVWLQGEPNKVIHILSPSFIVLAYPCDIIPDKGQSPSNDMDSASFVKVVINQLSEICPDAILYNYQLSPNTDEGFIHTFFIGAPGKINMLELADSLADDDLSLELCPVTQLTYLYDQMGKTLGHTKWYYLKITV